MVVLKEHMNWPPKITRSSSTYHCSWLLSDRYVQ